MPWICPPISPKPSILESKLDSTRNLINSYSSELDMEVRDRALQYYTASTHKKEKKRVTVNCSCKYQYHTMLDIIVKITL